MSAWAIDSALDAREPRYVPVVGGCDRRDVNVDERSLPRLFKRFRVVAAQSLQLGGRGEITVTQSLGWLGPGPGPVQTAQTDGPSGAQSTPV
jgi:hypothetical protein